MSDYTDEDVQTCIDWLYSAMHDDRQIPEMAENLLEDLAPRITRRAKAEAWDEGHATRQKREPDDCRCAAYYAGECGCGKYGTGRIITPNPYRADETERP